MRLTTKGRYAVTAMLDLALQGQAAGSVTLAGIAERQRISLPYLEQLFAKLRRAGLVSSVRGPGGGYRLAHVPAKISVADILVAIDENIDATRCRGERNCHGDETCLTHELWEELSMEIYRFLQGTTLADLAGRPHVQEVASRQAQQRQRIVVPPALTIR